MPKDSAKQKAYNTGNKHRQYLAVFAKWLKRNRLPKIALLWLTSYLVLMSFFLTEVNKDGNHVELFPGSLVMPALMHAFTALWIAVLMHFIKWPRYLAGKLFSVVTLSLFMINYDSRLSVFIDPARSFMPILPKPNADTTIISLLFLTILVSIAIFVGVGIERLQKKYKQLSAPNLVIAVFIVVGFMAFGQLQKFSQVLPAIAEQSSVQAPLLEGPKNEPSQDKPDIYYIVLDRYTNTEVLKDQFDFDNSAFTTFLRNNEFHVKDDAYAPYPYTTMSLESTFNGIYTDELVKPYKDGKIHSRALYHNLIHNGAVIKILKDAGYEYHTLGNWYGTSDRAPLSDRDYISHNQLSVFGKKKQMRGLEGSAFSQSPYYRFAQSGNVPVPKWPFNVSYMGNMEQIRTQLNTLDDLATSEERGGRFVFAHILLPHEPYAFNADGSFSPHTETDSHGKPLKQKFVEQVQFVNDRMRELVNNIRNNSSDAVILLIADEGSYPQFMNDTFKSPTPGSNGDIHAVMNNHEDMREWSPEWLKMKFGVLQAVHIPQATDNDLKNMSGVNAFRVVLNRYLGYDLDYLPTCHLGIMDGRLRSHLHANVTPKIVGENASPRCDEYQSLPS